MTISAHWALYSKERGDTHDYHIVATSGGYPDESYVSAIRRTLPGNPPVLGRPGPEELPWTTFAPSVPDDRFGISLMETSDLRAFTGSPTSPTRYFSMQVRDVITARTGYVALQAAVVSIVLPAPGGAPLLLDPLPLDLDVVRRTLGGEEHTLDRRFAAAAARLLESPVALLVPTLIPTAVRLAALDAIAALLPYGFRLALAAGTWAEPAGRQIRLHFGSRAREGQYGLSWMRPERFESPDMGHAADYLRLLDRIVARRGLTATLAHLRDDPHPRSFDAARDALDFLADLDRPFAVWQAARAGNADRAEARHILATPEVDLDASQRADIAAFLARGATREDLPALRGHWDPHRPQDLAAAIRSHLGSGGDPALRNEFVRVATERDGQGVIDAVLAILIASERTPSVAEGLLNLLVTHTDRPRDGMLPQTRAALAADPAVTTALIAREVRANTGEVFDLDALRVLCDWLRPSSEPGAAFARAVRGTPLAAQDLDVAAPFGVSRTLARAAAAAGGAAAVECALSAFLPRALHNASPDEHERWRDFLSRLAGLPRTGAADAARLDVLALRVGNSARAAILDTLGSGAADGYLGAFRGALDDPAAAPDRSRVAEALATWLTRDVRAWAMPTPRAERVLDLLQAALGERPESRAAHAARNAVVAAVTANRELLDSQTYTREWRRSIEMDRDLRDRLPRPEPEPARSEHGATSPVRGMIQRVGASVLGAVGGGGPPSLDEIASRCVGRMIRDQRAVEAAAEACAALFASGVALAPPDVERLLGTVRAKLVERSGHAMIGPLDIALVRAIVENRAGEETGAHYRAHLAHTVPDEVGRQIAWLSVLAQAHVPMDRRQRAVLEQADQRLKDVLKQRNAFTY